MRRKILITLAAVAVCLPGFAQALPSLLIPSEASVLGVGGAAVAGPTGAFAVDNNAAAMSLSQSKASVGVSYSLWQPSAAKDHLLGVGGFWHGGKLSLGASVKRFAMPSYEVTSTNGVVSQVDGVFKPADLSVALGGSFAVADWLSVGVAARLTSSSMAKDAKATVFGADISVMYAGESLKAALVVANLGGKVKYGESSYAQPTQARAGAAYTFLDCLTAQAELSYLFAGSFGAAAGLTWSMRDMLFVRAGFHYGSGNVGLPTFASLGLGGRFAGVSLDAAYLLMGPLGNTLQATLSYSF